MQIELPRVSPDGKTVAFIGGLMSDWRSIGGDLYLVPLCRRRAARHQTGLRGIFPQHRLRGTG
ncbi:MAG: hypothetical protein WDM89_13670 [Rhizomicrobium sp.]